MTRAGAIARPFFTPKETNTMKQRIETIIVCAECDGNFAMNEISWNKSNGGIDGVSQCGECGTIEGETKEITIDEYENS